MWLSILIRTLTPTIPIGNGSAHAVKVPGLIFLSGQVPADKSGKIVDGGIQEHTVRLRYALHTEARWRLIVAQAQCISNLGEVLEAAGSSWEKVVKVNVYLKDMNDFAVMNGVYEKVNSNRFHRDPLFFISRASGPQLLPTPKPARTCIQAAMLPMDVDIEIEAIATC